MKQKIGLMLLGAFGLFGQSAETHYFRAILLPSNEVPAIDIQASGTATLIAHVVRDSSGAITSGSVDFNVSYAFPGPQTFTGLHIHNGPAGVNAGVTIDTGLSGTNTVVDPAGRGAFQRQAQVLPSNQAGVNTLRGMVDGDPSQFYTNLHTTEHPGGVIRGQLRRAEATVVMGLMNTANEVPALVNPPDASGAAQVTAIRTVDDSGQLTSGQVVFDVNYRFPGQVTFTGLHIHNGPAGVAAGVTISSGIGGGAQSIQSDPSGTGEIVRTAEVDVSNPLAADTLNGLFTNPGNYYINLHTTEFPGGVIRAQLRSTDRMDFHVNMLPSNEVPPINISASGPSVIQVRSLRNEDGTVQAAVGRFDVNYRFPSGPVQITGLHIHDGAAGVNGPVKVDSGLSGANSVSSDTGFGNIFISRMYTDASSLATINSLVMNPENHYVNLHTTVNPGGVIRSQLAPPITVTPAINVGGIISAVDDRSHSTAAPGALMTIYGTNLAKVATNLDGWEGSIIPSSLNGVRVTVGGKDAPLLYVSSNQLNIQVPFDASLGTQPVIVNRTGMSSPAMNVMIAAAAPAIFFYGSSNGIVTKNADGSLVTPDNPAQAGDILLVWLTGLGQTTPALNSGAIVQYPPQSNTAPVTVTIGGQDAPVIYSIASPGFVGLYTIAVTMPAGVPAGTAQLIVRAGSVTSNTVQIATR